jgi:methionyl-tRNA formyltransferase
VQLVQVQRSGKQPMNAKEFLRGTRVDRGATLA